MITDDCPHEWSRRLSYPFTPACCVCGAPYNADTHDPAPPDDDLTILISETVPPSAPRPQETRR